MVVSRGRYQHPTAASDDFVPLGVAEEEEAYGEVGGTKVANLEVFSKESVMTNAGSPGKLPSVHVIESLVFEFRPEKL